MKNFVLSIIVALFFVPVFGQTHTQPSLNDPHWQLLWEDQFDDGSINTAMWDFEPYFDHWAHHNIVFLPGNINETGGNLVLTFKKENNFLCPAPYGQPGDTYNCVRQANGGGTLPYDYSGGYIYSKPAYDFKYGYVEARIKIDFAKGLLPGFWTFVGESVSGGNNASEIDIFEMEMGTETSANNMTCNLHYTYPEPLADPADGKFTKAIGNYEDNFFTFGMEWNPNEIIWYVNGMEVRTYAPPQNPNPHEIYDPVKILFTTMLQKGSSPDGTTPAQANMYVDYVRVFKKQSHCGNTPTYCIFNWAGYVEKVRQDITIGCLGSTNTQPANTTQYLSVTNSLTIASEFTVPVGSIFIVDIDHGCY